MGLAQMQIVPTITTIAGTGTAGRAVPSAIVAAFMAFAYDLYVVSNVDGLDDLLLNRPEKHRIVPRCAARAFC